MDAGGREAGMPLLGWWLMLVGSLRLASVWFGFFNIWALRVAVFSQADKTIQLYAVLWTDLSQWNGHSWTIAFLDLSWHLMVTAGSQKLILTRQKPRAGA